MQYAGIAAYLILGVVFTLLFWDEDTDEWYGDLTVPGRYFFFAKNLFLWPFCLIYETWKRVFRRKRGEEECG